MYTYSARDLHTTTVTILFCFFLLCNNDWKNGRGNGKFLAHSFQDLLSTLHVSVLLKFHTRTFSCTTEKRGDYSGKKIRYFQLFIYSSGFLISCISTTAISSCFFFLPLCFCFIARARFVRISYDHPPGMMNNHIAPLSLECRAPWCAPWSSREFFNRDYL